MSTPERTVTQLVANGAMAADPVAIATVGINEADRTRKIIAAALEALIRNNMVKIVPMDQWPPYFEVSSPSIRADVDRAMEIIRAESYVGRPVDIPPAPTGLGAGEPGPQFCGIAYPHHRHEGCDGIKPVPYPINRAGGPPE